MRFGRSGRSRRRRRPARGRRHSDRSSTRRLAHRGSVRARPRIENRGGPNRQPALHDQLFRLGDRYVRDARGLIDPPVTLELPSPPSSGIFARASGSLVCRCGPAGSSSGHFVRSANGHVGRASGDSCGSFAAAWWVRTRNSPHISRNAVGHHRDDPHAEPENRPDVDVGVLVRNVLVVQLRARNDQWTSCANASLKNGSLRGSSARPLSVRANRKSQTPMRPIGSATSIQ